MNKPKYKNPSLVESVFELRFPPKSNWGMSSFIKFANLADKEGYPHVVDAAEGFQFNFAVGKESKPPEVKPVTRRVQTWNKDETQLWQASSELYAANRREPYEGWENFRPHILKGLEIYLKSADPPPKEALFLSMQNVNKIVVDISKHKPSDYLNFLPPEINYADKTINFGCHTEQEFSDDDKIIVMSSKDLNARTRTVIVLNIIYKFKSPSLNIKKLKQIIENGHEKIINAFEESITDLQKERMKPIC